MNDDEKTLLIEDLEAAIGAMDSWVDAFEDEEPEQASRVKRVIERFEAVLDQMRTPEGPVLRLVPPPDEVN